MTRPSITFRRRDILAIGAALALPSGCAVTRIPSVRDVNLDALTGDLVLLLGHIHATVLGFDRTGDTFVRATDNPGDVLLPPDGEVAWIVQRQKGLDVRLGSMWVSANVIGFADKGPMLAPYTDRTAIYYFGTIDFTFGHRTEDNRSSNAVTKMDIKNTDNHVPAMRQFVAKNRRLARRPYCNVAERTILEAPEVRG